MHYQGFIHRDLKPENMMISHEDSSLVYLIDFGLSMNYMKKWNHIFEHIDFNPTAGMVGTLRYL